MLFLFVQSRNNYNIAVSSGIAGFFTNDRTSTAHKYKDKWNDIINIFIGAKSIIALPWFL